MSQQVRIQDNFLDPAQFKALSELMLGPEIAWRYNPTRSGDPKIVKDLDPLKNFQFTHSFYQYNLQTSNLFGHIVPICNLLKVKSLIRIKANLNPSTEKQSLHHFHYDINPMIDVKKDNFFVSIFYINTNNGYTQLEDGTKIESVANRVVTFPGSVKHSGVTCTDQKVRILINFNYF
tara:strand:+ start:319 stop:849 length:531 start_codon:yes stop_codon:yes gene_type:complete